MVIRTNDTAALVAAHTRAAAICTRPGEALSACLRDLAETWALAAAAAYTLAPDTDAPLASAGHAPAPFALAPAGRALVRTRPGSPLRIPAAGVATIVSFPGPAGAGVLVGAVAEGVPIGALLLLSRPGTEVPDDAVAAVVELLPVLGALIFRLDRRFDFADRRFVVALESAGDAIELCNRDAIIEWVNPAFEAMTGFLRAEAVGRTPAALFRGGQHPPEFYEAIDRVMHAGETWRGRMLGRRKSGEIYPQECTFTPVLCPNGEIDCVIAIRRDITERVRAEAEERHRRSNEVFRSLVEVLPDGVVVQRDGRMRLANPAMARLLGVADAAALTDQHLARFIQPADAAPFERWLSELEDGTALPEMHTWHFTDRHGQALVLEIAPVPWPSYEGGAALLLVARDMTDRHRLQARVLMADRLSAMGMLLAGIGHEINNPLAYAQASLEMLRETLPPRLPALGLDDTTLEEVTGCLDDAWHGVRRIAATVADFRAFSRVRTERGRVDLERLVELTARMAQNEIRPRAHLVLDVAPVPPFEGEENRIAQVVLNLLINAAQAIPDGHADEHEIRLTVRPSGADVEFVVADTGAGIPPEIQRRIFEPFFTTKAHQGGSGLGLSICHAIAREQGGSLTLESEVGRGSTFTFRLPLRTEPLAPVTVAETTPPPEAPEPIRRVLVIDDEPLVARAVERILHHDNVEIAAGGRAGLDRLRRGGPWDAVLCDLVMPDCSGADVFETIVAEQPALARRFVFLSGGAFTPRLRNFIETQHPPLLGKPFDNDALRAAIGRVALGGDA